jgi:phosphoribosylformylglycinamidine synthase
MKAIVKITLKKGVLDPQGKAIGHALAGLGYDEVGDVRQGKIIELELPDGTSEARIKEMCEKLLANPVMEDYELQIGS